VYGAVPPCAEPFSVVTTGASPSDRVEAADATSGPGFTVTASGAAAALTPLASVMVRLAVNVPGPA
jgi:hypothetical protein